MNAAVGGGDGIGARSTDAAGEPIFLEGGPGDAMFVLHRGAVVARLTSVAGDVIDLGVAAEGHAATSRVVRPAPRTEDAVAVRDSTVVVVPAAAALRALRTSPDTLLAVARDLVRIVGLQNRAAAGCGAPSTAASPGSSSSSRPGATSSTSGARRPCSPSVWASRGRR
ncbi:MAG: hypothetical protein AVDCRST_MAG54-1851 [uncultured Actinomycetospora sp.]|uniref:Cyclic nucleotide-binding domain-containing protein n=1 Tax=uncultured Actinomycetospora sp. TaxID=1135996 RepID=A0A6J4IES1_9PSEU|nr:MAG: hypothetical protein AVDCRST_MAG54-1851 [uncultured Actinomycetospora sp.]